MTKCEKCGVEYDVGDWPFCKGGHGRVLPSKGFEPHFDIGLGRYVNGWGDVRQAMREEKLDFRDHPSREKDEKRIERSRRIREAEER